MQQELTPADRQDIRHNIASRQACELLAQIVGELVDEESSKLPDDRAREIFWRLIHERWEAHFPQPQEMTFTEPEPYRVETVPDADDEVNTLVDEIDILAGAVPDAGQEFAESCCEHARGIAETVEESGRVTSAQLGALRNMRAGLKRWVRDA